jgi:hypothetical protein
MARVCRTHDVDGVLVRAQWTRPPTEADLAALGEVVRAAEALMAAEPLDVRLARQQRQEESRARLRRLRERLDADPS